jgi:hypothetical protein
VKSAQSLDKKKKTARQQQQQQQQTTINRKKGERKTGQGVCRGGISIIIIIA